MAIDNVAINNVAINNVADESPASNQSQPMVDSGTALGGAIWRRYATSPGVIPLGVTRAVTGRISRMADDHLPLFADLLQRWALPAPGSESNWADLPYATVAPWGDNSVLPVEGVPLAPTPHRSLAEQGLTVPVVNPGGAQPARSDAGGSANVQADLAAPVGLASAAVDNSDLPLATPVDAQSVQRNADGSANVQAALAPLVGSVPIATAHTDTPLVTAVGTQPAQRNAGGPANVQADLAAPVGLASVAVDNSGFPQATPVGARSVQRNADRPTNGQAALASPVGSTLVAGDHTDISQATPVGAQSAQNNGGDVQAALAPLVGSAPTAAAQSVQRSLASEVGDTPLRRRIRVGPPMVEPALAPASAGSTPMLARNSSTLEAGPVGWQQTEQTANVTQPTPPDRAQPRTVGPPIVRALDQPLIQAQPEFAPAGVGNLYGAAGVAEQPETSNPAAVTPLGRLLDPTRAAVSVHLPNERGGGAQQALLMAKPAEQDGIDALSRPAAPMVVVAGKANTDQEVRSRGLAGHSSTSVGAVAASIDQGSRPASVRQWPDSAQASGSPPVLGKPAPDMVWRAIDQSNPPPHEMPLMTQPLSDATLAQDDGRGSVQLAPSVPVTQPFKPSALTNSRLASPDGMTALVQRAGSGALGTAAIPTVDSEPLTSILAPADWRALATGVSQPLPVAQTREYRRTAELPLATAPATGLVRFVQTAPANATSSPAQASAGAASATVVTAPSEPTGTLSGTANQEAQNEELIEKVTRRLLREVAIERERQGWQPWNRKS